jgi:lipopolysaccharide transport system ATP-binding protein
MADISLDSITVDFPIYNATGRSFKNALMRAATGGRIGTRDDGRVVVRALENITLRLQNGDRLGIVGHNGSGKTTLLRVLSGVYYPASGSIHTEGKIASLINMSLGTDPEATGRENIRLRGALLGLSSNEIAAKVEEIIEFTELGEFIDMPVRTYSSGMQVRLAFATATVLQPDIVLMDEWLSVGDESFRAKAEKRLELMVLTTKILVIASHSQEQILKTCNRAIWLERGRVRMDGDSTSVVNSYFGQVHSAAQAELAPVDRPRQLGRQSR